MTSFDTITAPHVRARRNPVARLFDRPSRESEIRQGIAELEKLNEHMLRDVGLDRNSNPDVVRYGRAHIQRN